MTFACIRTVMRLLKKETVCVCMCVRKKSRGGKECVWVDVCFHVMTQKEGGEKLVLKFRKSKSQT